MNDSLVSSERLANAKKVLFIAHLAIGDYQYLQTYFQAFSQQWPHLEIHLWVDEVRRTRCFWRWKNLQRYSLYDWLLSSSIFKKIYTKTYSPAAYKKSAKEARLIGYDIIISLATLRTYNYAKLARFIGKNAFVVGIIKKTNSLQFLKRRAYKLFDKSLDVSLVTMPENFHITDVYAGWFFKFFGLVVNSESRAPFIYIPREWVVAASLTLLKWGVCRKKPGSGKIVFVNTFAKDKKRCWPLDRAFELVKKMQADSEYEHAYFIINTVPESYQESLHIYRDLAIGNTNLFSAQENFFQLPAMLSLCDLIISVETSIIHMASALNKPVIALMRQKNPEWAPWNKSISYVVKAQNSIDWVKNISSDCVKKAIVVFTALQK